MNTAASTRVLAPGDIAALRDMLTLFAETFEDAESYLSRQPDDAYLAQLLASDAFIAVAAFDGGTLTGGLTAYVLPKFEQARSEIYIYDLAVHADHRHRGVATAMIEVLQHLAAQRGAYVIFVQADQGDDPAIALYTRLGTRADVLHFDIPPRR